MATRRKHLFTVAELAKALNEFVENNPAQADLRILFDSFEQYHHWDGTLSGVGGDGADGSAVLLNVYTDLWERDE